MHPLNTTHPCVLYLLEFPESSTAIYPPQELTHNPITVVKGRHLQIRTRIKLRGDWIRERPFSWLFFFFILFLPRLYMFLEMIDALYFWNFTRENKAWMIFCVEFFSLMGREYRRILLPITHEWDFWIFRSY